MFAPCDESIPRKRRRISYEDCTHDPPAQRSQRRARLGANRTHRHLARWEALRRARGHRGVRRGRPEMGYIERILEHDPAATCPRQRGSLGGGRGAPWSRTIEAKDPVETEVPAQVIVPSFASD